jgi:sugar transferase EpsL
MTSMLPTSKRIFDLTISALALLLLLPILLPVALVVRLFLGRPVLLRQERP